MIDRILSMGKRVGQAALALCDLKVTRVSGDPRATLLGLRSLPIRTVIDVGANVGQFASEMRHVFPMAEIHAFEPLPETLRRLEQWALAQEGHVHVYPCALGADLGEVVFREHVDHSASSSILASTQECSTLYPFTGHQRTLSVRQSTLDHELNGTHLKREILLKLDVQGYEERVLAGAAATLPQVSACVVEVNIAALYDGQPPFQVLVNHLADFGLTFCGVLDQALSADGSAIYCDAVFRRRGGSTFSE
jgi:FkbM family methyltransferase